MPDLFGRRCKPLPFRDLLPWADPYIAGLVERLRRHDGRLLAPGRTRGEAAPPLDVDPPGLAEHDPSEHWQLRRHDDELD